MSDRGDACRVLLIYPTLNLPRRNGPRKQQRPFPSLLLPAIVHGGAPNAADLLPHRIPGVTGGGRDADRVLRSFV